MNSLPFIKLLLSRCVLFIPFVQFSSLPIRLVLFIHCFSMPPQFKFAEVDFIVPRNSSASLFDTNRFKQSCVFQRKKHFLFEQRSYVVLFFLVIIKFNDQNMVVSRFDRPNFRVVHSITEKMHVILGHPDASQDYFGNPAPDRPRHRLLQFYNRRHREISALATGEIRRSSHEYLHRVEAIQFPQTRFQENMFQFLSLENRRNLVPLSDQQKLKGVFWESFY